jgi:chromosome segregation ATPase
MDDSENSDEFLRDSDRELIHQLQQQIQDYNNTINEQQQQIQDNNYKQQQLEQDLNNVDNTINELKQQIQDSNNIINEQQQQDINNIINEQLQQLKAMRKRINNIETTLPNNVNIATAVTIL